MDVDGWTVETNLQTTCRVCTVIWRQKGASLDVVETIINTRRVTSIL